MDYNDIYYLNISELKSICDAYSIDYIIYEQTGPNIFKKVGTDRKEIMIKKILNKIKGIKPITSIIPLKVINHNEIKTITHTDKVYYGQYKSTNTKILKYLKANTDSTFHFGPIAIKILYDKWLLGKLITYKSFAKLWLKEYNKSLKNGPIPEWRYLTDLYNKVISRDEWKEYRKVKAKKMITLLKRRNI